MDVESIYNNFYRGVQNPELDVHYTTYHFMERVRHPSGETDTFEVVFPRKKFKLHTVKETRGSIYTDLQKEVLRNRHVYDNSYIDHILSR